MKINSVKIKKGDQIIVNAGKDRGKQGKVETVLPKLNKVVVIGINPVKRHLKPSRKNPHGGIIDKLMPLDISNVTVICPRCSQPTRVGYKLTETKKMRICKKCHESLNA